MADSRRAAEAAAAEEEAERAAISFATPAAAAVAAATADVVAPTSTVAASLAELEAERALHRRRAERFGGEFVDPVSFFFFVLLFEREEVLAFQKDSLSSLSLSQKRTPNRPRRRDPCATRSAARA